MTHFNQGTAKLKRMAVRIACLLMVTVAVWGGALVPAASAVGSSEAAAVVNDRAQVELDRVAGAGTSDRIEGAVDSTVGKAKRGVGRMTDTLDVDSAATRLDGATDELKGKVKSDIGRAKSAADDLGDDVEDKASGIVESVKDFFD